MQKERPPGRILVLNIDTKKKKTEKQSFLYTTCNFYATVLKRECKFMLVIETIGIL